jgi:PAS domain S-box-containing protein
MATLIRQYDWASTALGPITSWPASLKTITGFLVQCPVPIVLLWGPDGVMIYNDAYAVFAGGRHPYPLGMRVGDGWPEVADFNAHVMEACLAGGTLAYKDHELTLYRDGRPEQVWLNLDYSPVLDEQGQPAGVIAIVVETTERVVAERQRAAEHDRQRQLFQQMPGFVGVMEGPEHVFEYVNEAFLRLSRRSGLIGRNIRQVFPDLTGQGFFELLDQVYATGETVVARGMELRLQGSDEPELIDFVYQPIRDEAGRVTGIFAAGYEVTEAHRAASALRASEMRYRTLFDSMSEGFCVFESMASPGSELTDFRYLAVNPAFEATLGVPGLVGRTIRDAFPANPQEVIDIYDRVVATGQPVRFERRLIVQGLVLEVFAFRLDDESRQRVGVIFTDITVRKRAEDARNASEARLRELNADLERQVIERTQARGRTWQVSPDLMGALNSEGYFETSNPAWMTTLGWSEQEVASMSIFELLHPDDVERTREGFNLTQQGHPAIRFPNRYRRKDGSYRWISWVGVPEDGMVYCSGRDITEEKAAEAELLKAQEALRQSQKMEAVGQLTGGIAHDFNNLLVGIAGSLELIEKRLADGSTASVGRYIEIAQTSTRRAAALTQRLLAFSRRQTLDPKPTDVNRLVGGMEDLIRRTVGPSIAMEVVGAGGLWLTRVDPSQLESALLNLAINARDAMPDGGRITIETANKWLDHHAARERDLPPGQYVSLCVTDTGTGMTADVIERAFDPFFTTKPLGEGTGLGLSMIHGFVRQSGGQVRIYSELGRGTTMCLYLPRFAGDPAATELPAPDAAPEGGHGETVLVIDDEQAVRFLIAEILEEGGYRVLEAADGQAGLKILQSDIRIDLLITDVGLPGGVNGRQVADASRTSRPHLKILFITGYAENAVIANGHLDPGMQLITKPFTMTALAARVRDIIEG